MDHLDLPVFTHVFRLRRRLYRVYDVELPVPVTLVQVVVFAAAAGGLFVTLQAAGVELSPGSAWAFIVPPGVLAWLASRPVADLRSPVEWATAQVRHVMEPRTLASLRPAPGRGGALRAAVWVRRSPRRRRT